ncbi:50S ribosomal protein L5 [bacterium]|jgi:large subunit ribosomal protein L5|nr:50S ribosomal protein L5 [bacterium]MBT6293616.1 50S ribosomal protein L5 [bacterium]
MNKVLTHKDITGKLAENLGLKNPMALPRISKITISAGIGKLYNSDKKVVKEVVENLTFIAGQKPVVTKARLSISNFKLREEMPTGVTVTLRGRRMFDFLNNFIHIVCPRIRDFQGYSERSMDGQGNISVGIKEHLVFPEINPDDLVTIHGLQINIKTTAKSNKEGVELLKLYNFPFKKQ